MNISKRRVLQKVGAVLFLGSLSFAASLSAADFYVSPSASGSGTGSFSSPWQLQVALSQPGSVHPGDTIWLRGGTYSGTFTGYLVGTSSSPIIVRQYAGERAIIDGGNSNGSPIFVIAGSYTWYWGFEVMSSDPIRSTTISGSSPPGSAIPRGEGILIGQGTPHPGLKFINMIIHDARQGISFWKEAQDSEIYGCLIYYNGWQAPDNGHGHGIYAQNQTGTKKITDTILYSGFSYGIHAYGSGTAYLDNIDIEGTTTFNAGNLYADGSNLLLGGESGNVAQNPILKNNYMYRSSGGTADFNLGYNGGCSNATVTNNYISNSTSFNNCAPTSMTGNTFYGSIGGFTQSQYPSNTYYSSRPSGTQVFLRPNAYEAGRANITIYNWNLASSVSVSFSGILSNGQGFEIRNAHDFFGAPRAHWHLYRRLRLHPHDRPLRRRSRRLGRSAADRARVRSLRAPPRITRWHPHSHPHAHVDTHCHADPHVPAPNGHSHADTDPDASAVHSHSHPDADADAPAGDVDTDPHGHPYAVTDCPGRHRDAHPDRAADPHEDSDAGRSDADTDADGVSGAGGG